MKVGIIGAMASEVALLKEQLSEAQVTRVAGMEFCEGALGGTPVVVVQCGIGKVNAGICVQVLVDRFGVSHVINTGVAGSLDDRLDVGDLVVSTDCVWHDFDVTPLGYRPGEIPGVAPPTRSWTTTPSRRRPRATAPASSATWSPAPSWRRLRRRAAPQPAASHKDRPARSANFSPGGLRLDDVGGRAPPRLPTAPGRPGR